MESNTSLAPLHIPVAAIVAGLNKRLEDQRANRDRIEELETEGFDDFVAALTSIQKVRVMEFVTATYGNTAEEIAKENAKQAEIRDLKKQYQADTEDKPILDLLALYTNVTDKEVEVAPNDAILRFLTATDEA